MKIAIRDLREEKSYPVDIKEIVIENNLYIRRIIDIKGDIAFYYNDNDKLTIDYQLDGIMVCPDAYTLEDVDVPFELEEVEEICFKEDEEGFLFKDQMTLEELLRNIVLPEVPIMVEKSKKRVYDSGDGWSCMSEEDFQNSGKDKIDPRWEKLMTYKEE